MASIDKRNDGCRVRWRDPDGIDRSRQLPMKRAAVELQEEVDERIAFGRRWQPGDAREAQDLWKLLMGYAEECARVLRPNTAVRYARALDLFLRYLEKIHGKGATFSPALSVVGLTEPGWTATGVGAWSAQAVRKKGKGIA